MLAPEDQPAELGKTQPCGAHPGTRTAKWLQTPWLSILECHVSAIKARTLW